MSILSKLKSKQKEEPKLWLDIYGNRKRMESNLNGIKFVEKDNGEFEAVVARCGSGRSIILDTI